ncbi:hypothetical protein F2Q68_00013935 [Brassica cretica]|uniref:Uncharacterized protein n=1 Tax=Brassica cretica TaxID=69181 RepID=A0A8S9HCT0_BRACR|nr:hypothetical protein F2Q68_00013935 [Brassica cretica]
MIVKAEEAIADSLQRERLQIGRPGSKSRRSAVKGAIEEEEKCSSRVASLVLLEMNATQSLNQCGHLTEEALAIVARTYAIEFFSTFYPKQLP